jgi:hypothetical protein
MKIKTINTRWTLHTYDVWGNPKDGYEVNDVYNQGEHDLDLSEIEYNPGTPQAFTSAHPTDRQIKRLFGVRCHIETDGDDLTIYVNRKRDGYPIGEMRCQSHDSLSPIRAKAANG